MIVLLVASLALSSSRTMRLSLLLSELHRKFILAALTGVTFLIGLLVDCSIILYGAGVLGAR